MNGHRVLEFDSFRIDIGENRLLRNGEVIYLQPKTFDILRTLAENPGHTFGKDELMERIWADSFVEEGSLSRNISTLRKVLGDDSHEPRFIETIPKRGYRFAASVHEVWEYGNGLPAETQEKDAKIIQPDAEPHGFRFVLASIFALLFVVAVSAWILSRQPASNDRPATIDTENGSARELYKRGRELWQNRSWGGLMDSIVLLEEAVQEDPNYAPARAALADAYAFTDDKWQKTEPEAREAIRLDPAFGQPYASIGFVRMFREWDLKAASEEFRQAVRLSPDYATAHQWYALNLAAQGELRSLAEMKEAQRLDPASLPINADLCQILYFSRRYDEAIAQCQRAVEMDPTFKNSYTYLYDIYNKNGMYDKAVETYIRIEELNGIKPTSLEVEKHRRAFADGGIRAFWQSRIDSLSDKWWGNLYEIAQYHARLGQNDEAIRALRGAYEKRHIDLIFFYIDPAFVDLHEDVRFQELVELVIKK